VRGVAAEVVTAIATAGVVGRLPWAPGTWGSALGLLIGVVVCPSVPQRLLPVILVGTLLVCVPVCSTAERQLDRRDPREVVLDEAWGMAAVVLALPWMASSWGWLLLALLLFRVFDIMKPPPLTHLAELPAGWGVLADDFGAAVYTGAILLVVRHLIH